MTLHPISNTLYLVKSQQLYSQRVDSNLVHYLQIQYGRIFARGPCKVFTLKYTNFKNTY